MNCPRGVLLSAVFGKNRMNQQELRELENRCIQEQAPACTAACPLHVDGRALSAAIARSDFTAAAKIFRKTVPFAGTISHICTQPCMQACLRKDLGGAIEMAALERACLEYGAPAEPVKPLPKKNKRVAVVGGGLCGLTAAYDLAKKGWQVTVFESSSRVGGGLWQIAPDQLPRDILQSDLAVLDSLNIDFRLGVEVGPHGGNGHSTVITRLCDEFEAVFLSIGANPASLPDLRLDLQGQVAVDPLTFQTSIPCVFAGGEVLRISASYPHPPAQHTAILSMSEARRAAVSIDRYLQKVSLTASRSDEGAYQTRLYTNTAGIETQEPLIETDLSSVYTREVAETEAARCIQCECLECVKSCEYLAAHKGYPKKYIREIYNNLSIVMGTRHANQFINSCALCGLCAEVCPTDVDMGAVCQQARQQMVEQKRMPPSAFDFALRDMAFSRSEKFAMSHADDRVGQTRYVFFPGCQLSASSPEHTQKAYQFLRDTYPDDGVGIQLGCCGAPAAWAGRNDLMADAHQDILQTYAALDHPTFILACSSCYQMFQKYMPQLRIISLWDIYNENSPVLPQNHGETSIAIHDPCSTRYEAHIQDSVRALLTRMGYTVDELPLSRERTECCSYGGLMWNANRPLAEQTIRRRIGENPQPYVTYCAMCRDFFARQGKPTYHILDLIYDNEQQSLAPEHPGPGYSQRHENRARLKAALLKEYWSEFMPDPQTHESIRLSLSVAIQAVLEERMILVEDIQKVIENAERTGKRMQNAHSGHYLAYFKPTSVTYWVEYSPQADGSFIIHNAYSHRMEIGQGASK